MGNKFQHILFSLLLSNFVLAQDLQFTQFYAAPMFLNPAFTGLTYEHRFTANYRNQWPGIKKSFSTYMAAYDYNLSDLNAGAGAYIIQDRAGSSNLTTTQGGINFAYRFKVNKYSEIRAGIGAAMAQKKVDYTGLVFNDQLITGEALSQDAKTIEPIIYADLSLGALYNSTLYWFGFSARHLNQPNTSMTGNTVPLPVSFGAHGGYRFIISSGSSGKTKIEEFVSACINLRAEQKYSQLDIGAYYFKSFLNVGLWYRGLPFKKYKAGYPTRESVAILLGVEIPDKNFRLGYSYDLTISRLGLNSTQGAHEVSIIYEMAQKRKRTRRVLVSCPKF